MSWHLLLAIGLLAAAPTQSADKQPALGAGEVPRLVRKADMNYLVRDWPEAARLYQQLVDANPTVGLFWYRLGESLLNARQYEAAIAPLEQAEKLGGFQPSPPRWVHRGEAAYLLASAHATLGRKDEAIRWTQTALEQGLRDIRKFQAEPFAALLNDSQFRELVCADDLNGDDVSRDEGFRRDLHFAIHELKRVHFSPFRATSEAEIDEQVAKLDAEIPRLSDDQIFVRLMAIVSLFGDEHTRLLRDQALLPVRLFRFPEGVHVVAATTDHADLVGARVLSIGGRPADEALETAESLVAEENPMTHRWHAPLHLQSVVVLRGLGLAPAEGPATLEIEDAAGKRRTVELAAPEKLPTRDDFVRQVPGQSAPVPLCLRNVNKTMWHELLPDGETMYCQLNGIGHGALTFQRYFEKLFAEVEQPHVKRLILDLRWNTGGNTFLNPPLIEGIVRSEKFRQPGNLFVVIGRNTFSAAINTTDELERRTTAILVGEPTSSPPNFVGESVRVVLPHSGWPISVSDLTWQTSYPMDYRVWMSPLIYAPPTAAAFRAHRDVALEAIQECIQADAKASSGK